MPVCRLYDVKVGDGAEIQEGDRVVVHYECKWRGITFVTSRQGVGVTGGEPYGFDGGATGTTKALKGLDLGVRGMRVGGLRKLIVPPNLGYGDRGTSNGEIPGVFRSRGRGAHLHAIFESCAVECDT